MVHHFALRMAAGILVFSYAAAALAASDSREGIWRGQLRNPAAGEVGRIKLKLKERGTGLQVTGSVLIVRGGKKDKTRIEADMDKAGGHIVGASLLGVVKGKWRERDNKLALKVGAMKFLCEWQAPLPSTPQPTPPPSPQATPTPAYTPCPTCPFRIVSAKVLADAVLNGAAVPLEFQWDGPDVRFPVTVLWNPASCPQGVQCKAESVTLMQASHTVVLSDLAKCAGDLSQFPSQRTVGYYLKLRDQLNRSTDSRTVYFDCLPH